jgi:hypothetical protein
MIYHTPGHYKCQVKWGDRGWTAYNSNGEAERYPLSFTQEPNMGVDQQYRHLVVYVRTNVSAPDDYKAAVLDHTVYEDRQRVKLTTHTDFVGDVGARRVLRSMSKPMVPQSRRREPSIDLS